MPRPDRANIQGLIVRLYRYPISRHLLFRVTDPTGARAMLRGLLPEITSAARDLSQYPEPLVNVGLTWGGLVALGAVGARDAEQFDDRFTAAPDRSFAGTWDGRLDGRDVHLTVHLHCRNAAGLEDASARIRAMAAPCLRELKPSGEKDGAITGSSLGSDTLHFGFRDGISEPVVNWEDTPNLPDTIDMRHFLLGYYTSTIQTYPRDGTLADLVRDGSYAGFQWIYQDTAAFEAFLDAHAPAMAAAAGVADGRELLAAKMMGRWRDGTPLVVSPDAPDPARVSLKVFSYADDPVGLRCPLTAHVRIANRRDQPLKLLVAPNFPDGGPYLLRRGMAYGDHLKGSVDDGRDRGLVGMFICADLAHFTLVMKWINRTDFSPALAPDYVAYQDMMMADRAFPGAVTRALIPVGGAAPVQLASLPAFVRIKGTLMLFLPSVAALTRITAETG